MGSFIKFILSLFLGTLVSCSNISNSLVYHPDNYLYAHPDQFKVKFTAFTIPSKDQTTLSAWRLYSKNPNPKRLLLYFHGNAQNLTSHFVNTVWMTDYDTDIIIFDYRGFGRSGGSPEPQGLSEDGETFLSYAHTEFIKGHFKQFVVYGQSLGGAVVMKSLENFPYRKDISLLVLDSTLRSPRDVARKKSFWPLSLIVSNEAVAKESLDHLTMPILSIHSTNDYVIHYVIRVNLYNSIKSSPKKEFWSFDDVGHGDVFFVQDKKYQKKFIELLDSLP